LKTRIQELDVLRGLAAIAVMIYHYTVVFTSMVSHTDYRLSVPYGVYAVHLFFMISGFVITLSLDHAKRPLDFVVSRFSRLYPVFWVAVLLTQSIVFLSPPAEFSVSWWDAIINLTMIPGPLHKPLVDNVYWSLVIELVFYGILYTFWFLKMLPRIEWIVIPWCLLQILAANAQNLIGQPVPQIVSVLLLLKYAHLFLAGIIFYRIRCFGFNAFRILLACVCLATEFFVQGVIAGYFSILFFVLFLLLSTERLQWIAVKPLLYFGGISYSLYLVHQNIGFEIMLWLDCFPFGIRMGVAVIFVIFISHLLRTLVELPAMAVVRAFYRQAESKISGGTSSP
jgi:peptidoglycan/LPS O-acetylase OafA/YrhL